MRIRRLLSRLKPRRRAPEPEGYSFNFRIRHSGYIPFDQWVETEGADIPPEHQHTAYRDWYFRWLATR